MGDRHVEGGGTRCTSQGMLRHFEQGGWRTADAAKSKKPMPDSVRMLVRERARSVWK